MTIEETILSELETRFEGVDRKILSRVARSVASTATTEEEARTAAAGVTFSQVLQSYGDSRATDAQKSAVTNYERKHGLKDGKKVDAGGGDNTPNPTKADEPKPTDEKKDESVPSWAKELIEGNKALRAELDGIKNERTANTRKDALSALLKDAPEKIRQRYEKDFARMTFTDDDDFNGWIEEIKPDVESIATEYASKGGVVTRPKTGGGNGKSEPNPHLAARIKEREAAPATAAVQGLPQTPTTK